jgi:L-lactate dehydrogenase complex protein LldE
MRVALLVTCLVEAFAPQVADAAAQLIAATGADVEVVPIAVRCCGQPAWNAGYPAEARILARALIPALEGFDRIIVPSGSCATMLIRYYPHVLPDGDPLAEAARSVAGRTSELTAFLAEHLPAQAPGGEDRPAVAFHPSCHSLRGAGVGRSGERCLEAGGCEVRRTADPEGCCGFGGLFAIKEDALSVAMADRKLDGLVGTGADVVAAGELGCLLHLEGRAKRRGLHLRFRHVAELLAERRASGGARP